MKKEKQYCCDVVKEMDNAGIFEPLESEYKNKIAIKTTESKKVK